MATAKSNETTKLVLKVETDTNANGQAVYSQRTFTKINPALSNDDFLAIGNALGALQSYVVGGVVRQDAATILNA